ncbi:MAG: hypothetical protein KDJ14_03400 [Xanthomonadales bacterium]|nr:hypothetical protein [Xanthomonadales bacterium]
MRRLVERLRNENWTSVGIELVIVVLGVFLGLQAQEWSTRRQTEATAAEYAARLMDDFRSDFRFRSFLYEYYDDVRASNERVLEALEGASEMEDEALLVNAFRATQYIQWYASPSTYGELVSIGGVDLIRDESMRDLARQVYAANLMQHIEDEGSEAPFRRAFRSVVPLSVQRALGQRCGDRQFDLGDLAVVTDPLDYPCETGLSPAEVEASLAALRGIEQLVPMLRLRVTEITTRMNALRFSIRDIKGLLGRADAG